MITNRFVLLIGLILFMIYPNPSTLEERKIFFKPSTLYLKDLTWPQIIFAINNGYHSVIVPTGGIEQNGPHMIIGKHDYIIQFTSGVIASELGDTLIAPIVSFVPEGNFDPKTGNMKFPGTIGISEDTFSNLLEGIARSLKNAGFKNIYFLGDHGGSINSQEYISAKLTNEWQRDKVFVSSISNYYHSGEQQITYLLSKGYTSAQIGDHAGMLDTSELMSVNPSGVTLNNLISISLPQSIRGDSGEAQLSSADIGKILINIKIQAAISQIKSLRK